MSKEQNNEDPRKSRIYIVYPDIKQPTNLLLTSSGHHVGEILITLPMEPDTSVVLFHTMYPYILAFDELVEKSFELIQQFVEFEVEEEDLTVEQKLKLNVTDDEESEGPYLLPQEYFTVVNFVGITDVAHLLKKKIKDNLKNNEEFKDWPEVDVFMVPLHHNDFASLIVTLLMPVNSPSGDGEPSPKIVLPFTGN